MASLRIGLALAAALAFAAPAAAAAPANGELVTQQPCARASSTYEAYVAGQVSAYQDEAKSAAAFGVRPPPAEGYAAALVTRAEFDAQEAHPTAWRQVLYGSDGLKVAAGFIVVGVQYRGVDGGEGLEQFGGEDVHDVLNAVALARRLPEADPRNIFLEGVSRGGMEAMLALGADAQVNAAAITSPFTDLELEARERPAIEANVWAKLIPGYAAHRAEALAARSGVRVAKTIDIPPLLLMHGTADWRADPRNSTEVAEALKARGRPYELHIFKDDVHGLQWNWRERDRLVIAWFRDHMRR